MRRRPAIIVLLFCLLLGFGGSAAAQYTTTQVKAAFLFNFAKFTNWPTQHSPQQTGELIVGIMGRDPFGPALQPFRDYRIHGRPVRIRDISTLAEARGCHILFIAASESPRLRQILQQLPQSGLLTVSDIPGFAARGGMIELLKIDQRIRFIINLDASRKAGLTLSAHLLKLARNVIFARGQEP